MRMCHVFQGAKGAKESSKIRDRSKVMHRVGAVLQDTDGTMRQHLNSSTEWGKPKVPPLCGGAPGFGLQVRDDAPQGWRGRFCVNPLQRETTSIWSEMITSREAKSACFEGLGHHVM